MKTIQTNPQFQTLVKKHFKHDLITRRILPFALLLLFGPMLFSCKVTLVPAYDSEISKDINSVAKKVDSFYILMTAKTKENSPEREFKNFVEEYAAIQVDINALYEKNRVRSLNENSVAVCKITSELWVKYTKKHTEENKINDANIELRRLYMRDAFFAMSVAEEGKKFANNSPN